VAWAAIDNGQYPYGFIAKSTVCRTYYSDTEYYDPGTYYREYFPNDPKHPYYNIKVTAIKIARSSRTADEEEEVNALIDYLNGKPSTFGKKAIQNFCYKTP
jgi:hypothetical protein